MSSQLSGAAKAVAESIIPAAVATAVSQTRAATAKVAPTPLQLAKRQLRAQIKSALSSLDSDVISIESNAITQHIISHPTYKSAKAICIFMSMEKEVQTAAILAHALSAGKHCFVPRILDGHHMLMLRVTPPSSSAASSASITTAFGAVIEGEFESNSWGIPEPPLPAYWHPLASELACADPCFLTATASATATETATAAVEADSSSPQHTAESLAIALLAAFADMKRNPDANKAISSNSNTGDGGNQNGNNACSNSNATASSNKSNKWWRAEARDISCSVFEGAAPAPAPSSEAEAKAATETNADPKTGTETEAEAAETVETEADAVSEDAQPPVELVLMPGVAFDGARHRIGYGRGYFDRYVASLNAVHAACSAGSAGVVKPPVLWGLGLRVQVVDRVPVDGKDVPLDAVCTPDGFM